MMTYPTEIKLWSNVGHTPITKRKGAYCDEVFHGYFNFESPLDARIKVLELIEQTPNAVSGYFEMPGYWNQNTRTEFVRP